MTSCCDSCSISRARSGSTSSSASAERIRSQSSSGMTPAAWQCLGRQQLDPQPELELVPLGEELAQLRQGVAVDHRHRG